MAHITFTAELVLSTSTLTATVSPDGLLIKYNFNPNKPDLSVPDLQKLQEFTYHAMQMMHRAESYGG